VPLFADGILPRNFEQREEFHAISEILADVLDGQAFGYELLRAPTAKHFGLRRNPSCIILALEGRHAESEVIPCPLNSDRWAQKMSIRTISNGVQLRWDEKREVIAQD
jgi:hypothetical protein